MRLSLFTPVHASSAPFLVEAFESLLAQTHTDWEWVILENAGGVVPDAVKNAGDERVVIRRTTDDSRSPHNRIGRLKREACAICTGEVLVELDADDLLREDALSLIAESFGREQTHFAYSNSARFDDKWNTARYSAYWGWRYRDVEWRGHKLAEAIAWPPAAQSFRRIEWAPNHVRAWRASSYRDLGGHRPNLLSGDDHDLVCRTYIRYGESGIDHIDECIYFYRVHANTCVDFNVHVQSQVALNYLHYIYPLAERYARDNDLRLLDLGGAHNPQPGYETVDMRDAHIIADLRDPWPFKDDSVGVIRAHHTLEHLPDVVHAMNEAYRVMAPGAFFFIEVPSVVALEVGGKRFEPHGAFRDPTHRSFFTPQSFWYYTDRNYARFIPEFTGRFQVSRIHPYVMGVGPAAVPVIAAELICLKPPYNERPVGEVLI